MQVLEKMVRIVLTIASLNALKATVENTLSAYVQDSLIEKV